MTMVRVPPSPAVHKELNFSASTRCISYLGGDDWVHFFGDYPVLPLNFIFLKRIRHSRGDIAVCVWHSSLKVMGSIPSLAQPKKAHQGGNAQVESYLSDPRKGTV